ncbi:hypothetical protein [Streptomyces sp. NPDC048521]|uniref:hypothetical protein n=1 Tax=Streptomyces sp. NPDC048521 TaxID=3365566 RepID=UPI00371C2016
MTDTDPTAASAGWIDGDPLMEAIAAAVWEHCGTDECGVVTIDDPRNIAAVAAHVARTHSSAGPAPATDRDTLRERIAEAVDRVFESWRQGLGETRPQDAVTDAVLDAVPPAPDQQTAVLAEHLVERCPDHGCVEPAWEDGCHCEVVPLLRRLAGEAHQPRKSTAEKAADLGLTDTEYRAQSHAAAVATIRAAIPGMYAHVGFLLEDVLKEAEAAQQDPTQDGRATLPCNWARTRQPHTQHDWEPQPGMDPVHCPGHPAKLPPMDPVHILGIGADAAVARSGQPDTEPRLGGGE